MSRAITTMIEPARGQNGKSCQLFRNDAGVKIIRIGVKDFECIGETPPQDHPHIYLEMGAQKQILCPYCSTLFQFDPSLHAYEANPQESIFSTNPRFLQ